MVGLSHLPSLRIYLDIKQNLCNHATPAFSRSLAFFSRRACHILSRERGMLANLIPTASYTGWPGHI